MVLWLWGLGFYGRVLSSFAWGIRGDAGTHWPGKSEIQMEIVDREKKRGFCMSAVPAVVEYDCDGADAYVAS